MESPIKMNKTRASRSPTKLGTRTRPVTRSKSPRVPSEEPEGREPAGKPEGREPAGKPPDSPKKSMSPRKSARPKPQWSSSSRPVTKDSSRKSRPQTKDSTRSNSIANKRCDEINSLSLGMLKTWLKDAKAQLKQTERYET